MPWADAEVCRLALRVGTPRPWGELLTAPHGLEVQAYAPRELRHGTVNVDGTGVAWWPPGERTPLRYATVAPPWADPNLASLGPRLHATVALAAVRSGTPGVGHGTDHVAPFVVGDLAIGHNGWLGGFRDGVAAALLRRLPDELVTTLPVVNDSRLVAAMVGVHHRGPGTLRAAVTAALRDVAEVVVEAGQVAPLNLFVTDGREAVVARTSVGLPGNSLYVAREAAAWPDAVVVASEPLDGPDHPDWEPVPDRHLVHVADGVVTLHPLPEEPA